MEDNVDISKINGFSAYYNNPVARTLTEGIYKNVTRQLNRRDMGLHVKNFYVMRGTWTPSLLLEGGFVPNPVEFEWLTDEKGQAEYAKSIADAIAAYFGS
jgi:N-acetylmuramoyl-L-alanine amidase